MQLRLSSQIVFTMFFKCKDTEFFFMTDEFCNVYEQMAAKLSLKTAKLLKNANSNV